MKGSSSRLQKELNEVLKSLPEGVEAVCPSEGNLHEIHFVLRGPDGSPFAGGQFWGKLVFPPTYPAAAPDLFFFTPQGRFEPGKKICASFTSFHPESWNVSWRLSTLLVAILSFLLETDASTAGAVNSFAGEKRRLAACSWRFNAESAAFRKLFPSCCKPDHGKQLEMENEKRTNSEHLMMLGAAMCLVAGVIGARLAGFI